MRPGHLLCTKSRYAVSRESASNTPANPLCCTAERFDSYSIVSTRNTLSSVTRLHHAIMVETSLDVEITSIAVEVNREHLFLGHRLRHHAHRQLMLEGQLHPSTFCQDLPPSGHGLRRFVTRRAGGRAPSVRRCRSGSRTCQTTRPWKLICSRGDERLRRSRLCWRRQRSSTRTRSADAWRG